MSSPRVVFRLAATMVALFSCTCSASAQQVPKAQVVLFTPSDVKPPPRESYTQRLGQFGVYAEKFFSSEMERWGYTPARKQIFERDADGRISVVHVTGDLPAAGGKYKEKWISRQVIDKLQSDHGIQARKNLLWIFVYVGDPPAKHDNYRGAGNARDGGWAALNYTNLPGEISLKRDMASGFHDKTFLKGCIHEFGHALGLPHLGPKVELRRGNTLMGPITRIYVKNRMPLPTKAYLSEGSAAMLSVHPAFTGDATDRNVLPKTTFGKTDVRYDRRTRSITVRGTLTTNHPVHRIVVIDDRDDKIGAYWVKSFVSEVDEQSQFSVSIPRPNPSGSIKLLAVYKNGAVTGDGVKHGIGSAKIVPYSLR